MSACRPTMRVVRCASAPGTLAQPPGPPMPGERAASRRPSPGRAIIDHHGVSALDARRIERALAGRARYRYVQPRLQREGLGWAVLSPNCSRTIDARGGEILIAWLVPAGDGAWLLHSREHAQGCWRLRLQGPLTQLLQALCADPQREYWV